MTKTIIALETQLRLANTANEKSRIYRQLVSTSLRLEDIPEAERYLSLWLNYEPDSCEAHYIEGVVRQKKGENTQSIKSFKTALTNNPSHIASLYSLGTLLYQAGDTNKSMACFESILKIEPNHIAALFNMSLITTKSGHFEQSLQHLNRILKYNPADLKAISQKGHVLLLQEKYEEARLCFTMRLSAEPHHADTWHSLGLCETHLDNLCEAKKCFENCLEDNASHPLAHHDLANVLVSLGDYSNALTHYFKHCEQTPDAESFYNIAVILMHREHHEDSLTYFIQSLKIDPHNKDALVNIGNIYLKQNKVQDAVSHYQQALEMAPEDKEVKHILSALTGKKVHSRAPQQFVRNLFNQYAPYYDQHLQKQLRYDTPEQLFEIIAHDTPANQSWHVIDLGCGTGLCGEKFKLYAKKLIGIDLAQNMIDVARKKNIYDQLICDDIHDAIIEYRDIDLIIAGDVFSYIGDLSDILQHCYNALQEGGVLLFTVEKSHVSRFVLQKNIRYGHNEKYLRKIMKNHNWTMLEIEPIILRYQNNKPVYGYTVLSKK